MIRELVNCSDFEQTVFPWYSVVSKRKKERGKKKKSGEEEENYMVIEYFVKTKKEKQFTKNQHRSEIESFLS